MSRKISTEFAIAVIVIVAGFFVGLSYFESNKISSSNVVMNSGEKLKGKTECKGHYYDANDSVQINGWKVGDDGHGGVIVQILNDDIKNLPASKDNSVIVENNQKVDLVDPSDDIINSLNNSSAEKTVAITIKGYAETCDSMVPMVSLNLGSVTLKKS